MQKTKTIQIGQRSFTLKELPTRAIWELFNGEDAQISATALNRCQGLLAMACPELSAEALLDLYPSEIEELWQGFEEVNAAFLGVVRRIGLIDILIDGLKPVLEGELREAMSRIGQISTEQFASSLPPATVPLSGTTATASS